MAVFLSPTRFLDARDQAATGHIAKTNPANAKLAIDSTSPAAQSAAHANANAIARPQFFLVRRQLFV